MGDNILSVAGTHVLTFAITAPIAYLIGQRSARKNEGRALLVEKIGRVISDIRDLSDDANYYYTKELSPADRNSMVVSINIKLRRISVDLFSLSSCSSFCGDHFVDEYTELHSAITSGQFGSQVFETLAQDSHILIRIHESEDVLIRQIRTLD